jgi:hypothetical protein
MKITPVDQESNLYHVENLMPESLVEKILATPWLDLPWSVQPGQQALRRRKINNDSIPWLLEWDLACHSVLPDIARAIGHRLDNYTGTAWWLDEPGFVCPLHTDGEIPGAIQLFWIGARIDLGTTFYWYKDRASKRYQFPMQLNTGYVMINKPNQDGYRNLLWHGMLEPVPRNTFRLTSYSWINNY